MATDNQQEPALLINYNWHHAVNDQSKLNSALDFLSKNNDEGGDNTAGNLIEAIEADIIHSEVKSQAVMGHPPSADGDLTLSSFLEQLRQVNFQQRYSSKSQESRCPVLKLDFKSMIALQSSLEEVKQYLEMLPSNLHQRVWINADIISGPGEDLHDEMAQQRMQPKFDAAQFLQVVTSQLPGTALSIGWTTSLADKSAIYTTEMVNDMIECAKDYPGSTFTFPVRASCFKNSWQTLQSLYRGNVKQWSVTLWWSQELAKEEFDWIYDTLENDIEFRNRTYFDLTGFRQYMSEYRCLR